jgi:lactate permease
VGATGGLVTGSNSGANAMFATTQAEIARSLGVDVLWFMAVHNVAAAFLLMASRGKV